MKRKAPKVWNAVRNDKDGTVDDVSISGDLYRLERMTDTCFWTCVYRGHDRTAFSINIVDGKLVVQQIEDSIGCTDD